MGTTEKNLEAGGSGSYSLGGVLLRGSTGGPTLPVRDMVHYGFNGEDNRGGTHSFIAIDYGEEVKAASGRVLAEVRGGQRATVAKDASIVNVY